MASRFQSRLVGTVILVALGAIFLPDLLDGKKTHYQDEISPIPIRPESQANIAVMDVPEPEFDQTALPQAPVTAVVGEEVQPQAISSNEGVEKIEVVKTKVVETQPKNDYQDAAWIIQLMALKNADNAARLISDLKKRGFTATSKKENGFTRILIGPDVSKEKLENQLVELEKITGAKGQLIKFRPLNP
ncbi:SPOR domain-containing protein [Vibrio sp. WJH972]